MKRMHQHLCLSVAALAVMASPVAAQWPQWGGPHRDFKVDTKGLAAKWPEDGPKRVWSRPLGEGYSSIAADGGRLFTMYRAGDDEIVAALDAKTGKTIWEHKYAAAMTEEMESRYGRGPNATPLIIGGRVYTVGVVGDLHCLDAKTGKPVWSHNYGKDFGATLPNFGCSSSPIAYEGMLIAVVGGKGVGVMAFDLESGSVRWKNNDFVNTYSSPIVIKVGGEEQVVVLTDRTVVGFDPKDGTMKWSHSHVNEWKTNINTPIWGDDGMLWVTAGGEAGSRGLRLKVADGKTSVEEVWSETKIGVGQNNVIRVGDYVYACAGEGGASFMAAVHAGTGKVAWRERGFKKATMLHADGKFILLDESGTLALATATPEAFTVISKAELFKTKAWTVPTLVGQTLYVRNTESIMAFDLSAG